MRVGAVAAKTVEDATLAWDHQRKTIALRRIDAELARRPFEP